MAPRIACIAEQIPILSKVWVFCLFSFLVVFTAGQHWSNLIQIIFLFCLSNNFGFIAACFWLVAVCNLRTVTNLAFTVVVFWVFVVANPFKNQFFFP